MSDLRDQMMKALKVVVIPLLRERGFTGAFPHLRRCRQNRIDLFTFQFDRHGGGFIIEIARCEPEGFTTNWGKQIPPNKVRAWDLSPQRRVRLQPRAGAGTDSWFRFDDATPNIFTRTAISVVPFLEQAEKIFDDFDEVQKIG